MLRQLMWRTDSMETALMLGKTGQEEKGLTRWDGWTASSVQWRESEESLGDSGGQKSLACHSPRGGQESDTSQNNGITYKEMQNRMLGLTWRSSGQGFPSDSAVKNSPADAEDAGSIPWVRKILEKGIATQGSRWGSSGNSVRLYLFGAPKSLQMVTAAMKLKDAYSLEEKLWPT